MSWLVKNWNNLLDVPRHSTFVPHLHVHSPWILCRSASFIQNKKMPPASQQDPPSHTQWVKIVSEDDRRLSARWLALKRYFGRMPRWSRMGGITLLLGFAVTALYLSSLDGPAKLQVTCQYNFRSAQLAVLVDGEQVYSGDLVPVQAAIKKHGSILTKAASGAESFSKIIEVPAGRHMVQVRVSAPAEGFDQARSVSAYIIPEQENILAINALRRNALTVSFAGPSAAQASVVNDSHPASKGGFTILFIILGTMLSASISFLVQEFWRSHKSRIAASR